MGGTGTIRRLAKVVPLAMVVGVGALLYSRGAHAAPPCTINWNGNAGDSQWQTADNWNPVRVPNTTDFACTPATNTDQIVVTGSSTVRGVKALGSKLINNGNLTLTDSAEPSTIRNLRAAQNKLSVNPGVSLTLTGHPVLSGGSFGGGGTITVPSTANLGILFHTAIRNGTTLNLNGPTSWAAGSVCIGEGSVVNNASTFTAAVTNNANNNGIFSDCVGPAGNSFNNLAGASLNRTGGAGGLPMTMSTPFNNNGTVNVGPGDLILGPNTAGTSDTGTYAIADGSTVVLTAARELDAAATVTGDGTLRVHGDVTFAGQTVPHLMLSSGKLAGPVTLAGKGSWIGGTFDGNTTATVGPAGDLTIDGDISMRNGRTLVNNGTIRWQGGNVCFGDGSQLTNNNALLFTIDTGMLVDCDGIPAGNRVHTTGTGQLVRDGAGLVTLSTPFDNDGALDVLSGSMTLGPNSTGFSDSGDLTLGPDTKLFLSAAAGGGRRFGGAATIATDSTALFSTNTAVTFAGQTIGRMAITGGTVSGPFTVSGRLAWSGGRMTGGSTTTVAAGATATISSSVQIRAGKTLLNQGTIQWNAGNICLADAAHLVNVNLFVVNGNANKVYLCGPGAPSEVLNQAGATLQRKGAPGQLAIMDVPVNNLGTIELAGGNLAIGPNSTGVSDTGTVKLGSPSFPNAVLQLASGAQRVYAPGATFTGPGLLEVTMPGTVTFNGQSIERVSIENGTVLGAFTPTKALLLNNAVLSGGSTTTIPNGAVATINGETTLSNAKQLVNNGSVVWNAGTIHLGGGSVITNNTTNFKAFGSGTGIVAFGGGANALVNSASGWITVNAPFGITIGVPFTNNGSLIVDLGTVTVNGDYAPGANSGLRVRLNGTEPGLQYGRVHATGKLKTNGHLSVVTDPGFLPDLNDAFVIADSDGPASGLFQSFSQSPTATGNGMSYRLTFPGDTVTLTARKSADLSVSISAPSSVPVGSDITYTDFVINTGPNPTSVTLTHTIAPNMTFVSAPAFCSHTATLVTCTVGTMNSGQSTNVVIKLHPMFVDGYDTTAKVTGAGTVDPTPLGATDTEHVEVT